MLLTPDLYASGVVSAIRRASWGGNRRLILHNRMHHDSNIEGRCPYDFDRHPPGYLLVEVSPEPLGQNQWRLDRTVPSCWNSVSGNQKCVQIAWFQRSPGKCRFILSSRFALPESVTPQGLFFKLPSSPR
jgi:hypothetical protein